MVDFEMASKQERPAVRSSARHIIVPRVEFETLKHDLQACSEQVGRLEKTVNALKDEVSHLREKIRN